MTPGTMALGERARAMIDAMAEISAEPGRLTRLYLTPEHKRAADLVGTWMRGAGLAVRIDAAGTTHGLWRTSAGSTARKRLLVGSHIDTVVDGGRFDGVLGIVAGILAIEVLQARGATLPFDIEILAFGDEEGVRFPQTLLASSAVAGAFRDEMLSMTDSEGQSVHDALLQFGCDPLAVPSEAYASEDIIGYVELHIEQGPVLEQAGRPLGVVTAIASQGRYRLIARGESGHAGTVPMDIRHDALAAVAEVVTMLEAVARKGARASLVATVGEMTVVPGASNVIPGKVRFSLDVRAATDHARTAAANEIRSRIRQIGARRGVVIGMETVHEKPVSTCAPNLVTAISKALAAVTGTSPPALMSGAGHDGQAMIHLTDIGMIFVRCRAGISHNPLEYVATDDLGLAVEGLAATILEVARET